MGEKWPPLDPGTRVRTTKASTPDGDWMPEVRAARRWGVPGTIMRHHDSHGLCYDVRHDDGTEGSYEPSEFEVSLRCKTCGMERGEHDRACVNEQLHALRRRIYHRMVAWRTQYEIPTPGPLDLNAVCKAVVDSAIKMVQETE
jgi:hypothetical protein